MPNQNRASWVATAVRPSWEVFDICDVCGVGEGKPCCNLKKSTPKNLVEANNPHAGRKMLKR